MACCIQVVLRNYVKCCKDQLYSYTNIARVGVCVSVGGLALLLAGSVGLLVANETRLSINRTLCQGRATLTAMAKGSPGLNATSASVNMLDVRSQTDIAKIYYATYGGTLQSPFLSTSAFVLPNTTTLATYYTTFCGAFTIKHPQTGLDTSVTPFAQDCAEVKKELDNWTASVSSMAALKGQLGSARIMNTLFQTTYFSWLNQIVSGSYIVSYATALALLNVSDSVSNT